MLACIVFAYFVLKNTDKLYYTFTVLKIILLYPLCKVYITSERTVYTANCKAKPAITWGFSLKLLPVQFYSNFSIKIWLQGIFFHFVQSLVQSAFPRLYDPSFRLYGLCWLATLIDVSRSWIIVCCSYCRRSSSLCFSRCRECSSIFLMFTIAS